MPYVLAVVWVVFVWWFSTGALLYLVRQSRLTPGWRLAAGTALLMLAFGGLALTRADPSPAGAYAAFTCSIVAWGWLELTFLTGLITGPRKAPCEPGSTGWNRFCAASAAILYHELAIALVAVAVIALTLGQPNQIGTWTILILWLMRLSAKLNLFLGVRNHYLEFLPEHLRYLGSYFRARPVNWLFPFVVAASTGTVVWLLRAASALEVMLGEAAGYMLLASLMTLALVEHWLLVLPISATALWNWGLRDRRTAR